MTIDLDRDEPPLTWDDYLRIAGVICAGVAVAASILAWQTDRDRKWAATHDTVGDVTIFIDPLTRCRFLVNEGHSPLVSHGGLGGYGESYTRILQPDGKPDCGQRDGE